MFFWNKKKEELLPPCPSDWNEKMVNEIIRRLTGGMGLILFVTGISKKNIITTESEHISLEGQAFLPGYGEEDDELRHVYSKVVYYDKEYDYTSSFTPDEKCLGLVHLENGFVPSMNVSLYGCREYFEDLFFKTKLFSRQPYVVIYIKFNKTYIDSLSKEQLEEFRLSTISLPIMEIRIEGDLYMPDVYKYHDIMGSDIFKNGTKYYIPKEKRKPWWFYPSRR